MNKIIAFHSLSRKYCIDRIKDHRMANLSWVNKFNEIYKRTKDFNSEEINQLYKEYPKYEVRIRILEMILIDPEP